MNALICVRRSLIIKAAFVAATVLLVSNAMADTQVPRFPDSALTLGSGVNLSKPLDTLPACFSFKRTPIDSNVSLDYRYSIKAYTSVDEVKRANRVAGSIGGSGVTMSARLEGWRKAERTDNRSALYVVIDAIYTGPRYEAMGIAPLPSVKSLFKSGKADAIVERCGTHIATMEHNRQSLRMVINLSHMDSWDKQEVFSKFSAKGNFGLTKVRASGSYGASVEKTVREDNESFELEGTGRAPDIATVTNLMGSKAGDLKAFAEGLKPVMDSAGMGTNGSFVSYGFTVQPIKAFLELGIEIADSSERVQALADLQDLEEMLAAEVADVNTDLAVMGLPAADINSFNARKTLLTRRLSEMRADMKRCLVGKQTHAAACDNLVFDWKNRITAERGLKADLYTTKDSAQIEMGLNLHTGFAGTVTLGLEYAGQNIWLDSFKVLKGYTRVQILQAKLNTKAAGGAPELSVFSEAPLTMTLLGGVAAMSRFPKDESNRADAIYLGCNNLYIVDKGMHPFGSTGFMTQVSSSVPPDSLCASQAIPGGLYIGAVPIGVYNPPLDIKTLPGNYVKVTPPKNTARLILRMTDSYGFTVTTVLVNDALAKMNELGMAQWQ
ncbi:hypothetical protein DLREEDagrD3_27910 [Denitratisoma sp. agr-D3]